MQIMEETFFSNFDKVPTNFFHLNKEDVTINEIKTMQNKKCTNG